VSAIVAAGRRDRPGNGMMGDGVREYVVCGVSHHAVPLAQREKFALESEAIPEALHAMCGGAAVAEAVLVSTCNRVEWYVAGSDPEAAGRAAAAFFADGASDEGTGVRVFAGPDAVCHAFRVAAGLDSMIIGEPEILGQMRAAFAAAHAAGTVGPRLDALFRAALASGRRVRRETAGAGHAASVPYAAAAHAARILGSIAGRRVLVIGAGKMGRLAARAVSEAGARTVVVANRTASAAGDLAARVGGETASFGAIEAQLSRVDAVIVSTAAREAVLTEAAVARACAGRRAPLVIVDIAVPRNVDPSVRRLAGAHLCDIDDLMAPRSDPAAAAGLRRAQVLVDADVQAFLRARAGRRAASLIGEARAEADAILEQEWQRARARLSGLDPEDAVAVRAVLRRVVNKVLHRPITALLAAVQSGAASPDAPAGREGPES